MKNFIFIAAAACVALAACTKETVPATKVETGSISFNVRLVEDDIPSRTLTAYTTAQDYEKKVNSVQILVFDESGAINMYKNVGTSTSGVVSTTVGNKTVWAVVNGPDLSSIGTLTALKNTSLDLSANTKTTTGGFVMTGDSDCEVIAGEENKCGIEVNRLAARVALVSVKNSLPKSYGAITIDRVFLSNVAGNQAIDGTATSSTWYNKEGRADESTRNTAHIINGSTYKASCPDLTFNAVATSVNNGASHSPSTPYLFYTYSNSSETAPNGFSSTFASQRTVLVVAATIGSTPYYYPVVLDEGTIKRNTAYTVSIDITGLGSSDPNMPVQKDVIDFDIAVKQWLTGSTYEEVI